MPTTLVGRAIVAGQSLRLETNSVERADRLRDLVRRRLGPQVKFRIREHADPLAQLDRQGGRATAGPPEAMPPEVLEVVRRMQAEHYQRWLDEPVPALDGLTPRDAAKRKCVFRPCRSAIPADADHPFRQGDHPGREAAG